MAEQELQRINEKKPWQVLEFYSGIGGMVTVSFTSNSMFLVKSTLSHKP